MLYCCYLMPCYVLQCSQEATTWNRFQSNWNLEPCFKYGGFLSTIGVCMLNVTASCGSLYTYLMLGLSLMYQLQSCRCLMQRKQQYNQWCWVWVGAISSSTLLALVVVTLGLMAEFLSSIQVLWLLINMVQWDYILNNALWHLSLVFSPVNMGANVSEQCQPVGTGSGS